MPTGCGTLNLFYKTIMTQANITPTETLARAAEEALEHEKFLELEEEQYQEQSQEQEQAAKPKFLSDLTMVEFYDFAGQRIMNEQPGYAFEVFNKLVGGYMNGFGSDRTKPENAAKYWEAILIVMRQMKFAYGVEMLSAAPVQEMLAGFYESNTDLVEKWILKSIEDMPAIHRASPALMGHFAALHRGSVR